MIIWNLKNRLMKSILKNLCIPIKIVLLLFVAVLFGSCGTKTTHGVDVLRINPHDAKEFVNLSEIVDSIKLIRLQTEGDDVIGNARLTIIKKKYIYVADISQATLFVFDKEGKFVSKLNKRGRGPNEYLFMGPILVDDNEEYIELYDIASTRLLKYSNISFDLLDTKLLPFFVFDSWRKVDDLYYCATNQIDNKVAGQNTNAGVLVIDSTNRVTTLFDKNIETGMSNNAATYYGIHGEIFTQNHKGELFVSIMFDNTFYLLKNREVFPFFAVDFGKFGMNNSIGLESTQRQMEYIKETTGKAAFPILNINNSDVMSFSYFFKQKVREKGFFEDEDSRLYLELKKNKKIYHVKYIKNDLFAFPARIYLHLGRTLPNHDVWYGDYLIEIVNPSQYFGDTTDEIFIEGLGTVTAMDNPIIVMMKLRKQ